MRPRVPSMIKKLYPGRIWNGPEHEKSIYLTFDDGPIPEVTPWVLEELKKYGATATFFCIGENVMKHPSIYRELVKGGHAIGNHTFHHLNGWRTGTDVYLENVRRTGDLLHRENSAMNEDRKLNLLFRPPYGRLRGRQAKRIQDLGYKIVMWDVLSKDYDSSISPRKCYQNVIQNAREASIIIFHDSLKAEKNLKYSLPKVLAHFQEKGYSFRGL